MNWRQRLEPFVRPLIFTWFRFNRGMTLGVRGIVERQDGHVVLVKHTYVPGWHLPGGGVETAETAATSLCRELEEEAGVSPTQEPELLAIYSNHARFRGDHVLLFRVRQWEACATDHDGEISAVEWFDPADLPEDTTPATRRRLAETFSEVVRSNEW
jgi:ADP-ribose pyrophosphatase YjhB (NUDIX family)